MKILFIGGTGIISSASSELALERGFDLYLLTRGKSHRPIPEGAKVLRGDIRDRQSAQQALGDHKFDVVVNWVAYTPDHIAADIERFQGRTRQYVFISSASAYHKPPISWPITESTPLHNPYWQYSRDKIACEEALIKAYRETGFPVTIVRPSHTYDKTYIPLRGGYTVIDRMRKGKKVIVHGDGTSLWVMTHHRDFAKGFIGLLGNPQAIGEAYHITADEVLCWNQIYTLLAQAAGVESPEFVHIPATHIATYDQRWGDSLVGDKSHSVTFDNTKIKRAVPGFVATIPFAQGAKEIMAWHDEKAERQVVDEDMDRIMDRMVAEYT